jgi:hypothetical protein
MLGLKMNKTIYIRDEDVPVWDRARELAGDKLAPVIVDGLKKFVAAKEAELAIAKGFERLEISFDDSTAHYIPRRKAFTGRWLFSPGKPHEVPTEDGERIFRYALALTAKGNVVIYSWEEDIREGCWYYSDYRFRIFSSLEDAAADEDANSVARRAIKELGVSVEELDI